MSSSCIPFFQIYNNVLHENKNSTYIELKLTQIKKLIKISGCTVSDELCTMMIVFLYYDYYQRRKDIYFKSKYMWPKESNIGLGDKKYCESFTYVLWHHFLYMKKEDEEECRKLVECAKILLHSKKEDSDNPEEEREHGEKYQSASVENPEEEKSDSQIEQHEDESPKAKPIQIVLQTALLRQG